MEAWPKVDCDDCDNAPIEIIPSAGSEWNKMFFEVKQKCDKHGGGRYMRQIIRKRPQLKLVDKE